MNTPQVLVGRELLRCTLSHLGVLKTFVYVHAT